jgi:predicted nucleic acid-binding protein
MTQERTAREAEAILAIANRCKSGAWSLLASSLVFFELAGILDEILRNNVMKLFPTTIEKIPMTTEIEIRAKQFSLQGLSAYDAQHLALAEAGKADAFLSVDDKLIKRGKALNINITVENPCIWLKENEYDRFRKQQLERFHLGTRPRCPK